VVSFHSTVLPGLSLLHQQFEAATAAGQRWGKPLCNPQLFKGLLLATKPAGENDFPSGAIHSFIPRHIALGKAPTTIPTFYVVQMLLP